MSEASRVAISEISGQSITLYAPVADREQFTNAIAYLVRRLDENTSEDNFIRYSFGLKVNSPQWNKMKEKFLESFDNCDGLYIGQRRKQNRLNENWDNKKGGNQDDHIFTNEPDTDFILKANRQWADQIRGNGKKNRGSPLPRFLLLWGGKP